MEYIRYPANQGSTIVLNVGTFDSQAPAPNGALILANSIYFQSASASVPGMVNLSAQTMAGVKTFRDGLISPSLQGDSLVLSTPPVVAAPGNSTDLTITSGAADIDSSGDVRILTGDAPNSDTGRILLITGVAGNGRGAIVLDSGDLSVNSTMTVHSSATVILDFHVQGNMDALGTIVASNFSGSSSGTNTGDVSLGTASGLSLAGQVLSLGLASAGVTGALSGTDWSTFNSKQAAGNYITALTGDATASGPGSVALTLATVNANVGSFGSASSVSALTVNAKGLVTAAASTSIQIAESQVTNLVSDLAGKQATGNYITALTGDVTAAGPGSAAATIAANAVTNAKAAQMAAHTFKGNNTGSTANALDLTKAQLTAELNQFTTSLQGVVPGSGGGTTNFLRADGSWAAPAGTSAVAPTVQKFTSGTAQTYTRPTSPTPLYIKVTMVGAGGGGAGGGSSGATNGGDGGATTFGTALLSAGGGSKGLASGGASGGAGGASSLGTGPSGLALTGGSGGGAQSLGSIGDYVHGGVGGASALGGSAGSSPSNGAGDAGATNTGGGGAGGGTTTAANVVSGAGGGAGGFVQAIITSPSSSYTYTVGSGGSGGSGGTNGFAGGAGGSGVILVEEFYQ